MKRITLLLVIMLLATTLLGCGIPAAFAASEGNRYDKTYVLEDLQGATIAGEKFDIANYLYTGTVETQLLTLSEYAYTLDENRQDNYAIYIYVYNPSGKEILSTRNAVSLATIYNGDEAVDYEKFDLQLLSVSKNEYAHLFYKFKIIETNRILARVNATNTNRRYDVSEIELNYGGTVEAIDVGNSWTYRGFAEGCGATQEDTLACVTNQTDTLKLNIKSAWWRINNGVDDSDTLSSVYFGVPNSIFDKYGQLQQIKANWFETKTTPIPVLESKAHYNAILPYVGKNVPRSDIHWDYPQQHDWADYSKYMSDCIKRGSFTELPYYFLVSTENMKMAFNSGIQDPWQPNVTAYPLDKTLPWLFYSTNKKVSSRALVDWMTDYTNNFGGELLIDKYSACLFEPYADSNRQYGWQGSDGKGVVIDADALFDIEGFNMWGSLKNFLNSLFYEYDEQDVNNIAPIYIVKDEDVLNSNNADIARKLLIDEVEVPEFLSQYALNKAASKQTVLFRFAVTKYKAITARVENRSREDDRSAMLLAQQTVFLDFDVIWLKFVAEGKETVVPTVAAPIDVVGGITPPAAYKVKWWLIVAIIVVVVLLLCIIFPPFGRGVLAILKGLWWVVTSPFRLIAWIIKKCRKTPQTDSGSTQNTSKKKRKKK
ncbi:MAG: hypothetical protein NC132_01475 [Corallococcus sp.]|nr:hypothetical protein [Corallococcus sp.]MCM1394771.1 hypothetical protein [Corallococcus sp.]